MYKLSPIISTKMEVTSIRLKRKLKEKLRKIAGGDGYQALIRQVLCNYMGSYEMPL
jgi:hypothetical protein